MQKPQPKVREPVLSEDQQAQWQEWLGHPQTRSFLALLKSRSGAMQAEWLAAVWESQTPQAHNLPEVRSQSRVYQELSDLNLEMLESLLEDAQHHGH